MEFEGGGGGGGEEGGEVDKLGRRGGLVERGGAERERTYGDYCVTVGYLWWGGGKRDFRVRHDFVVCLIDVRNERGVLSQQVGGSDTVRDRIWINTIELEWLSQLNRI